MMEQFFPPYILTKSLKVWLQSRHFESIFGCDRQNRLSFDSQSIETRVQLHLEESKKYHSMLFNLNYHVIFIHSTKLSRSLIHLASILNGIFFFLQRHGVSEEIVLRFRNFEPTMRLIKRKFQRKRSSLNSSYVKFREKWGKRHSTIYNFKSCLQKKGCIVF